jgi:hypothetical protein
MFAGMPGGFPGMNGGMAFGGGEGGGMMVVQMGGQSAGGDAQAGGQRQGGQRTMMGGAGMTPEQQQQMRAAFEKALGGRNMQDLSPEERQKIFSELRTKMGGAAAKSGDASKKSDSGTKQAATGAPGFGFQRPGADAAQGGEGRQRGEGRQGGEGRQRGGPEMAMMGAGAPGQFSQKDLDNAKLPPPPEEDSELNILLRPGLLADVEIIVEKVPNALYVPNQSVFEKDGKPVVYVKQKDRFVAKPIKIAKRSESVTIISEGVNAGDVISMSDPEAKPGDAKKGAKKDGGGASGMMPVGGSKGAQ